ncbi:MAG TPA: alpha/beta hydrolase-fold protein [Gaiellaceae bacterium]
MSSNVRRYVLVLAVVALVFAGFAAATGLRSGRDVDEQFPSAALAGQAHALVVLPPGYATSRLRYPVVYFLHGLPAGPSSYRASGWLERALEQAGPAILVEPQGARSGDTDPEYLNWGTGRNWETYVTRELPHYVDSHFRTIATRRGRAIVGLSAGGYGAAALGLGHLDLFSVVESWSGYFHPTDPTGTKAVAATPSANVHNLIGLLRASQKKWRTFFAFYVGQGDARFRAENLTLHRELVAAGVPHVFELYDGGHRTSVWEAHAPGWLGMALDRLAHPQHVA